MRKAELLDAIRKLDGVAARVDESPMLDTKAAAQYLNLQPRTLENWRTKGIGPRYVQYSTRMVRYHIAELDRWIDQNSKRSTREEM